MPRGAGWAANAGFTLSPLSRLSGWAAQELDEPPPVYDLHGGCASASPSSCRRDRPEGSGLRPAYQKPSSGTARSMALSSATAENGFVR